MHSGPQPHPACPGLWQATHPDAGELNRAIQAQLDAVRDDPHVHRSHHFHGRFENTYVPAELIPAALPLFDWVRRQAFRLLGRQDLRYGFWFNEMGPGHRTSRHSHDEDDELLSAVYYLRVPADSGRLVLWDGDRAVACEPAEGRLYLFPPQMDHEVEVNAGSGTRLSVAFNFGPPEDEDD